MKSKRFNGDRLKAARTYRGLTVAELADSLDLQRQTVSMYENGKISNPDYSVLKNMGIALGFPVEFFLQSDISDIHKGSTYFRSLLTTSKKYRNEQVQKITFVAQLYSFISEYVNFKPIKLPFYNGSNPEEAAVLLRQCWGLGENPIENIVFIAEENGIVVTNFESEDSSIDAFSQLISIDNEDRYLIGYSRNKTTAARVHFDIAHELGHILLHEWSEDVEALQKPIFKEMEKQAHSFASAFLLPKESFLKDLGTYGTSLNYYTELKKKWKVSISAMIRRAFDLGAISQFSYQQLMKTMQKKGIKKYEPLDDTLTTAPPELLQVAVQMLLEHDVFTPKEFIDTLARDYSLSLASEEIEALLGLKKGTLHYSHILPEHRLNLKIMKGGKSNETQSNTTNG